VSPCRRGRHPTIRIWDFVNQTCIATLYAHASALRSFDISPDGRALAAGSYTRPLLTST
jgi:WD40 repeat protein